MYLSLYSDLASYSTPSQFASTIPSSFRHVVPIGGSFSGSQLLGVHETATLCGQALHIPKQPLWICCLRVPPHQHRPYTHCPPTRVELVQGGSQTSLQLSPSLINDALSILYVLGLLLCFADAQKLSNGEGGSVATTSAF